MANLERLHTHDLELGATEAIQKHYSRHVVEARPVSQRKLDFEHSRPRWLREMMAEATGVFFYVFPGIAAVTTFTLNKEDAGFGSLLQVGFAFAFGIAFAIITCASTSGGHFNPAITICFATWQGFPWKKVPYYIFAQVFGAFMAGLLLMGMYWEQLSVYAEATRAAGDGVVFNGGPASVLCAFPNANQSLGYLFLIEFFVDSYIGIVIWSALDPANPFIAPSSAPFVIGLGKSLHIPNL
ncbi:hypothetical protein LTR91_020065 [Friedmanniomyces endolithicus]|uniref:Aquaporin-3 n=2 Tax=Dothideomycetidae TaxID=451867 RepID=A0AAN6HEK4_9PEZI|nr:hypothetical protein LTR94_011483 [Friedmanniomyces endolithicus]KAK5147459.1 hypothetical protein LTR32_001116 [Rachicladosporium monterosium]KAK0793289.1 hypothetical protein LTR59_008201 [Friedmanniomyces endolithicus]KAK0795677.1 hypothetical protein LTR38_008780 [Friedmanniomyces endolithicus]KAK0806722.1 hypothetical protein LTR75_006853 [Friedmanniomyces endolithicus]